MAVTYQICSQCIMDSSDPDIVFDDMGVCNHCHKYKTVAAKRLFSEEGRERALQELVSKVKARGKGRKYDCIIGVSGGVDSTYLAYLVKNLGLRPLAVHLDNGWNSELAVSNIEKTLKVLNLDLYTYVIDWHEFKDLQLAFLKASTPDSEIPTDHAIMATLFNIAAEQSVEYILLGTNVISESILPLKWGYGYKDLRYIKHIQKAFGKRPLKSYPYYSLLRYFYYTIVRRIKVVSILDYVKYDKKEVMSLIQEKLGWIYYGGKHYESVYTRFFQAYILPRKFNIDKRRAHYSNLICSGQLTRAQALAQMKDSTYHPERLEEDKLYAIKKFEVSPAEFEELMSLPPKTFLDYPNQYRLVEKLKVIRNFLEGLRA